MSDWYWSTNEERWGSGPHDTREQAAAEAITEAPGCTFWTCRRHDPVAGEFPPCAESILEQAGLDEHDPPSFWVAVEVQEHQ